MSARPPRCPRPLPLDKPAAVTPLDPGTSGCVCVGGWGADSAEPSLLYDGSSRESGSVGQSPAGALSLEGGKEKRESVAVRNEARVPMLTTLVSMLPESRVCGLATSQPGDKVI